MKTIIALLLSLTLSFAITPFSLEKLGGVNFKILDKNKILDKTFKENLEKKLTQKMQQASLHVTSERFANLLLKVKTLQQDNTTFCYVSLSLAEDVSIKRAEATNAIALTFFKDDFFETTAFEEELSESVDFLFDEFLSQFKEEN